MFTLLLLGSTSAIAQTQTADRPTRIALDWLRTLRSNDMDKLAAASQVPFVQEGFSNCNAKRADSAADLTLLLGCVAHSDKFFVASIPAQSDALADWHSLKLNDVPRGLRKKASSLAKTSVLVGGALDGDGVSYRVVIVVSKSSASVTGVLLEPNLAE